jgi:hypothetical protein
MRNDYVFLQMFSHRMKLLPYPAETCFGVKRSGKEKRVAGRIKAQFRYMVISKYELKIGLV